MTDADDIFPEAADDLIPAKPHGSETYIDPNDIIDSNTLIVDRTPNSVTKLVFDNDTCRFQRTADVTPTIEFNKAYQASGHDGYTPSRDLQHVAEIPVEVIEAWNIEGQLRTGDPDWNILARENRPLFRAKLNDPDNRFLRTGLGAI